MKVALVQQPLAVSIAANNKYIHSYASGVIDSDDCYDGIESINHAVLVVGYGSDAATGLDYWLIKNSWNTTWGDQGYFKLAIVLYDGLDMGICGLE